MNPIPSEFMTSTVIALIRQAGLQTARDRCGLMPIIADALQDAGYDESANLDNLRDPAIKRGRGRALMKWLDVSFAGIPTVRAASAECNLREQLDSIDRQYRRFQAIIRRINDPNYEIADFDDDDLLGFGFDESVEDEESVLRGNLDSGLDDFPHELDGLQEAITRFADHHAILDDAQKQIIERAESIEREMRAFLNTLARPNVVEPTGGNS